MPSWTKEQLEAINEEGKNIIVSAGAGSGKTAVLSERVIRKLNNTDINKLLILTFTKEAANEMKERIRKKIKKNPDLKKQLDIIDSAYITTFDSYSLSLVKKYYYLLNISPNISIIDASIINIKKNEYIEEIFDKLYEEKNTKFEKLIKDFCTKDDKEIKNYVIDLNNKLDLKLNKEKYINNYIKDYFNEEIINNNIEKYINLIKDKIKEINNLLYDIQILVEGKFYEKLVDILNPLLNSNTYEEIRNNSNLKLPTLPRGSEEEVKEKKEELKNLIDNIKELTEIESTEILKENILKTKEYIEIILEIIKELDKKIYNFKEQSEMYEFNDIAKMAIRVLEENENIRLELKNYYNEIMVDEYQDTNDIQEKFISLIENNNVYMVGDIKQSIYRFRNANPNIFRNKYNNYEKLNGGIKIDLLKNFRSRYEVLDDINLIFNLVMNDKIGGAEYRETHQMIFGNNTYIEEGKIDEPHNFEILNYKYEDKTYTKEEIEIFTIATDIKNKIENHYKVFDKDNLIVRDIEYKDFCIIMDRNTEFPKYKKIFEYMQIPLTLYQDEVLTLENDILVLKNIMNFVVKINKKEYDTEFKYCFTSIARSYLFRLSDQEIFDIFKEKKFYETEIFKISKEISDNIENLTNEEFINEIVNKFNIIENTIKTGNIEASMVRIEYLLNLSKNLTELGYTPFELTDYIKEMVEGKNEIKYSLNTNAGNNVKIMNIHKSKGLEFHICYYSGLHKAFNISDLKQLFTIDNELGIIAPYVDEKPKETIYKYLLKDKYMKEEIAEKIRLFYVAMTRCKEKMILVTSLTDKEKDRVHDLVEDSIRLKYKSFLDILNSIKENIKEYIVDIDLDKQNLTKDYNEIKENNYESLLHKNNNKIEKRKISINSNIEEEKHFSKTTNKLITKEEYKNMEFGTHMHYLLELIDFKNPDLKDIDNFYKEKINNFLNQELLKNIKEANIYKEYEFIEINNNETYHGIIDLMLEYSDHVDIIDYKLKNIEDDAYQEQLNGYKKYIENKLNKKVDIYLYSIMDNIIKKMN
ncbi:MAG: UvrD-helicase domain-containing protein [Bacilli bacterium]